MSGMKCEKSWRQFHCTSHHAGAKHKARVTCNACTQLEHERAPSAHRIYLTYFPPNPLSTNGMLFARFGNAKLNVRLIKCEVRRIWRWMNVKWPWAWTAVRLSECAVERMRSCMNVKMMLSASGKVSMKLSLSKDQRGTPALALARSWDFHSGSDPPNPLEPLWYPLLLWQSPYLQLLALMSPAFLGSPLRLFEKQTFIPVRKTTLLQTEWQCLINGQYFQGLRQLTNRTPYSSMATMQIKLHSRAAHQPAIFTRYPLAGHVWGFHVQSNSHDVAQAAVVVQVATGRRALLRRHREGSGAQLFVGIFQQPCQRSLQGLVAWWALWFCGERSCNWITCRTCSQKRPPTSSEYTQSIR